MAMNSITSLTPGQLRHAVDLKDQNERGSQGKTVSEAEGGMGCQKGRAEEVGDDLGGRKLMTCPARAGLAWLSSGHWAVLALYAK
jgi:hypothetical protein